MNVRQRRHGKTIRYNMRDRQPTRPADKILTVLALVVSLLIAYAIFKAVIVR